MHSSCRPHAAHERASRTGSRQILSSTPLVGIPLSGDSSRCREVRVRRSTTVKQASSNEPTPIANSYGVGSAARLKLREQMPHVGLHRLLREEEALTDLAVHEAVRDELQHLDLTGRRLLRELAQDRRVERDHRRPSGSCCAVPQPPRNGGCGRDSGSGSPCALLRPWPFVSAPSGASLARNGAIRRESPTVGESERRHSAARAGRPNGTPGPRRRLLRWSRC